MFKEFGDNPPSPRSSPDRDGVGHLRKRLFVLMAVAAGLLTGLFAVGIIFLR
jgi:hypothetical protein